MGKGGAYSAYPASKTILPSFPVRRPTAVLVLLALCLSFLTFFRPTVPTPPRHSPLTAKEQSDTAVRPPVPDSCLKYSTDNVYIPLKSERFDWRDVPTRNPVENFTPLPTGRPRSFPNIQRPFKSFEHNNSTVNTERREAVKATFLRGWDMYKENAWLQDEFTPITRSYTNGYGGWATTLIDSLDTLWVMDLKEDFEMGVAAVANISFNPETATTPEINIFEMTIRHLAGLIAAYDITDCKDERLLQKAVELGDMIYATFDTPNRMPIIRFNVGGYRFAQDVPEEGNLAELASNSLEFARLSQLTGDPKYYDAAARITRLMAEQVNDTHVPGLLPIGVRTKSMDLRANTMFSFGAMADSAYEYLGKTHQLLGGLEPTYEALYHGAMDTAAQYLLYRPSIPSIMEDDILFSANYHAGRGRDSQVQHLSCFVGGMYMLGGKLFDKEVDVKIGQKLTDGCIFAYKHAPMGIMPEAMEMRSCPGWERCAYDPFAEWIFHRITDGRYMLRPEAIESAFYAYRITGDPKYQESAWEMFQAIENVTRTEFANAAVKDVMRPRSAGDLKNWRLEHYDNMESFWLGDTLKYLYLIFSEPDVMSLDEWVFNTRAHAFRVPRP